MKLNMLILTIFILCINSSTQTLNSTETFFPGFIALYHNPELELYYNLFPARSNHASAPLGIWLGGQLGLSTALEIFTQAGPFHVRNIKDFESNEFSMTNTFNMLYIDQPFGTGYSNSINKSLIPSYFPTVIFHVVEFLQKFFQKFPEFKGRDIYFLGQDAMGQLIPKLVREVVKFPINLAVKGVILGNAMIDPSIQYPTYAKYAYDNNLIGLIKYKLLQASYSMCQSAIRTKKWTKAYHTCVTATQVIEGFIYPNFNKFDIRLKDCPHTPLCYDLNHLHYFLHRKNYMQELKVQGRDWSLVEPAVRNELEDTWNETSLEELKGLLSQGIKVLMYAGEKSFVNNWIGIEKIVLALKGTKKMCKETVKYVQGKKNESFSATVKSCNNLHYAKLHNTGYFPSMSSPLGMLKVIDDFVKSKGKAMTGK